MSEYQKQANDFLARHRFKFKATFVDYGRYFPDDKESRHIYLLTISGGDRRGRYSTRFGASLDMTRNNVAPTAYDLLACMTKSEPGTFEEFCSDYGYDTDSRTAERTYKAVVRDWQKITKFFTGEEIDEIQEIN